MMVSRIKHSKHIIIHVYTNVIFDPDRSSMAAEPVRSDQVNLTLILEGGGSIR